MDNRTAEISQADEKICTSGRKLQNCVGNISDTTAGECISIELDGISVYDLPERLKSMGLYLAEQEEE